jgi:prevent-host-death family protein
VHFACFNIVPATLTELRRDTSKVIRPAIHAGETVVLTEHGETRAKIVPVRKIDRQQALHDLVAVGPVEFPPRQ